MVRTQCFYGSVSIPGLGTEIPHQAAVWPNKTKQNKTKQNKTVKELPLWLSGLRIWRCYELWHRLQIWLRSSVSVAAE